MPSIGALAATVNGPTIYMKISLPCPAASGTTRYVVHEVEGVDATGSGAHPEYYLLNQVQLPAKGSYQIDWTLHVPDVINDLWVVQLTPTQRADFFADPDYTSGGASGNGRYGSQADAILTGAAVSPTVSTTWTD